MLTHARACPKKEISVVEPPQTGLPAAAAHVPRDSGVTLSHTRETRQGRSWPLPRENTSDFRDRSEPVCVEDPDISVAGFHHPLVAETSESLVDRLTADPEQHADGLLGKVDIWLTVGFLQDEIGHLSQNRLVHETNHTPLGLFHLAHPGHQPPHQDARMDRELGKQARPLESQAPNQPHRTSGGEVWVIAEHG